MNDMKKFDIAIIGAGPGGYVAAIRAAQLGSTVALIDKRERLGGTCLNIGCIPSKALLDVSEEYYKARHQFADKGILIKEAAFDLNTVMKYKDNVVAELTGGLRQLMKENKVEVFTGTARLDSPQSLTVTLNQGGSASLVARSIILATGSEPVELPFLKFDGEKVVSSTEILSLTTTPRKLIVVGAGYVGLELGSVWSRFGSEVTFVELMPQIIPGSDNRLAKMLQRALSKQGMNFMLETRVTGCDRDGDTITVKALDKKDNPVNISGDLVLVSVGRRPFTGGLGLENVGVTLQEKSGKVIVDKEFRTKVPSIYAIGDLIEGPMLAHKAEDDGVALAEILHQKPGMVHYDLIPGVVYTSPEVAMVGKSEDALKKEGIPFKSGMFNFRANGRALAMNDTDGYVKVLADQKTDTLLGVQIMGPSASELIAEAVSVMAFGGAAEDIARTVHAHPTLSEAVKEAAMAVDNWSIHSLPPRKR